MPQKRPRDLSHTQLQDAAHRWGFTVSGREYLWSDGIQYPPFLNPKTFAVDRRKTLYESIKRRKILRSPSAENATYTHTHIHY